MFQCIRQIHELKYDEKTKKGNCILTSVFYKLVDDFFKKNKKFNGRFLIGDPFFIDSMLQSMQLIIPQDISLPKEIKEIDLNFSAGSQNSPQVVLSNIMRVDADYYRGDAEVVQGGIFYKIKDCRLKVLDKILTNPTANELVNPEKRNQRIIDLKLIELSNEFGFAQPVIKCFFDERLTKANREIRHKIEMPVIVSALEELLKKEGKTSEGLRINWLKSGKPVVEGANAQGIGVSVSHTGSFLIVIAGYGEQGCDVQSIQTRTNNEWVSLLGKEKYDLLKGSKFLDQDRDKIATAIWSAAEVSQKLFNRNSEIKILEVKQNKIVFRILSSGVECDVVCILFKGFGNEDKILAFAFYPQKSSVVPNEGVLKDLGYDRNIFKTDITLSGPQGQVVYVQRFPITFKNVQGVGKRVYFSNYFGWIGDVREYSLYPIRDELIKLLESGKWGMATNHVKLQIIGSLKTDDIVESRVWAQRIWGEKDSVIDLMFEWFKVSSEGQLEKVAIGEQRVSWIQITGHGEGRVEAFPISIKKFFDSMRPLKSEGVGNQARSYPSNLSLDKEICNFGIKRLYLSEKQFSTSLEESNLVGNIYFANYGKWLGKVTDEYFYKTIKNGDSSIALQNEFFCTNCDIYHLKEAMPFDQIEVKLHLERVFKRGVVLYVEFFKQTSTQKLERLAYATQTLVWE